jgi:hypothetical protein
MEAAEELEDASVDVSDPGLKDPLLGRPSFPRIDVRHPRG